MTEDDISGAIWTDEPFDVASPDIFGRDSFVATVVKRIQNATATDASTVFGLVGPWGSGKTSVLNRVRAGLAADWLIADFTPWSSGDSASMSLEFVNTLADVLGEKTTGDTRAKLASYAGYAAPLLSAIPFVGAGVRGTAEQALDAIARRPPWQKQFAELSGALQSLGKRVLIVVDDVDRLGGGELLTLLRVIRLLGRFRGVHYLVAYDQETVEDLLRSVGSVGRSAAFMEKIVQYPFETPPLPRAAVIRLLNRVLDELLESTTTQLDSDGLQRATELVDIIAPQINTPRTLGRFREHLIAFADHVETARLDLLDYVGVTWLRLSAHGAWASLPGWHHELRTGARATTLIDSEKLEAAHWEARISEVDNAADPAGTVAVLSFLFEGVEVQGRSVFATHARAMSDPTYFGRYLLLAIPEDDVDDELIEAVVSDVEEESFIERGEELSRVLDSDDDALANLAISRMSALRRAVSVPNLRLLQFLGERLNARHDEIERVGAPRNGLRVLLAREIALAVTGGAVKPESIINLVGEKEALSLVWLAPRSPEFRGRGAEIANGFAEYWLERLPANVDEYRDQGMLGAITEIITYVRQPEEVAGLLDDSVSDYQSLIRLAISFVFFAEWVGSSVSYELQFRGKQFTLLISETIRERFRSNVLAESGTVSYAVDDHESRDVPPDVLRAFAVDSIAKFMT